MIQPGAVKSFLRQHGLMVNQCPRNRHRALAMRLRELGFNVRRVVKRRDAPGEWEVQLVVDYGNELPPALDSFRARLRRALKALGYRCPKSRIRVGLLCSRLTLAFRWPDGKQRSDERKSG